MLTQATTKYKLKVASHIRNIVKELHTRNIEFHTYKLKQVRSFKVFLKHMPLQEKIEAIKSDIQELGHKVTSTWNIKKLDTKVHCTSSV